MAVYIVVLVAPVTWFAGPILADLREMIRDLKRNPWKFFWKE